MGEGPNVLARADLAGNAIPDVAEPTSVPAKSRRRTLFRTIPFSIVITVIGSGLQGYANSTLDAIVVAFLLLAVGSIAVVLVFPNGKPEQRVFLLTYATCIFAGGFVQTYSLAEFRDPQSFVDAIGFFSSIYEHPPYYSWYELNTLWLVPETSVGRGAPLAVAIWQQIYHIRGIMGFDFGPYIGIMFNALVMGLTGSVTVRTARELFGSDSWRLRRVGTLFAFCGLLILFGSLLIRDCFTTFFNALVLWGLVRWLCRPRALNLAFAIVLTLVAMWAMAYLRSRSIVLFGLYSFLALFSWFLSKRLDLGRFLAITFAMIALLFGSTYLMEYLERSQSLQQKHMEQYQRIHSSAASADSLGLRLVVNQPMPIRLVLGTGSLMIFPIPLWAYFHEGVNDYHLVKGYHGIYQVIVMPLVLAGFLMVISLFRKDRKHAIPHIFLALYLTINVLAVVATSVEQRHIAQFMPAFVILAALPDARDRRTRRRVTNIAVLWMFVVIIVHLAWALAKMG